MQWMQAQDLLDAAVQDRLMRLQTQVSSDKITVAFVAEFSRGKSELINAIFFAHLGRRIMPAGAGRTTMCPTELGYDHHTPPCLRLLPIETRLQPQSLLEWRAQPQQWTQIDLNLQDPEQLAQAMQAVAQVSKVTREQAQALGFWHEQAHEDNPMPDADGLVQVPRWRHALINLPHPLLKQGLVILDTPGLNAIGAEPELTISLIPQAHAVVFILGADTGVTRSDLAIWNHHLRPHRLNPQSRLVVLNKIDTLWDDLTPQEQIQAQIAQQRESVAHLLELAPEQVLAVSAQKGLLAKITQDNALLQRSQLQRLELALSRDVLQQRQQVLRAAVQAGITDLRYEAGRLIGLRRRDLAEQMLELQSLRGKNAQVIEHMRQRVQQERSEFEASGTNIHALRSVHLQQLQALFVLLSAQALKAQIDPLLQMLASAGVQLGAKKAYAMTFENLHQTVEKAAQMSLDIRSMLAGSFDKLNRDYGFSLQLPKAPELHQYKNELDVLQYGHEQYLGLTNLFRLDQKEFRARLVRMLQARLRVIFESALEEVQLWNKSVAAQLNTQLRERRRNFSKRMSAIERIQQAASGLDERIQEIEQLERACDDVEQRLSDLTVELVETFAPTQPSMIL